MLRGAVPSTHLVPFHSTLAKLSTGLNPTVCQIVPTTAVQMKSESPAFKSPRIGNPFKSGPVQTLLDALAVVLVQVRMPPPTS
jgi:hypothetical protein